MDFTVGLSGYDFKSADVAVLAGTALSVGAESLELWPHNFANMTPKQILRVCDGTGVSISCVNASAEFRVHGPITMEEVRHHLQSNVALAREIGAPLVNIYIGPSPSEPQIDTTVRVLEPVLAFAEANEVTITVENHFDNRNEDPGRRALARTPEGMLALCQADPRLRSTFDPANYLIAGLEPFPFAYRIVKETVAYVHVKDVTRSALEGAAQLVDAHEGTYSVVPVGAGSINYWGLLRTLLEDGYQGVLMVEPHVPEEEATDSAKESIDVLRRLISTAPDSYSGGPDHVSLTRRSSTV